jgi:hypothetical protein
VDLVAVLAALEVALVEALAAEEMMMTLTTPFLQLAQFPHLLLLQPLCQPAAQEASSAQLLLMAVPSFSSIVLAAASAWVVLVSQIARRTQHSKTLTTQTLKNRSDRILAEAVLVADWVLQPNERDLLHRTMSLIE